MIRIGDTHGFLMLATMSFVFGAPLGQNANSSELADVDSFVLTLREEFPEYKLLVWAESKRSYRKSPTNFVDDILFGDFNSDGFGDFAALLVRDVTDEELSTVAERHRDTLRTVVLVVVCDGLIPDAEVAEYRCSELSEPTIGGVRGQLDFVDWTRWVDYVFEEQEQFGNQDCQTGLKARTGMKSLSLVEPIGHCDAFFYPLKETGYGQCMYCAD